MASVHLLPMSPKGTAQTCSGWQPLSIPHEHASCSLQASTLNSSSSSPHHAQPQLPRAYTEGYTFTGHSEVTRATKWR